MNPTHVLWDSCALYCWLGRVTAPYWSHLDAYRKDAEAQKVTIYLSSIALAELRPSAINKHGLTPADIISGLGSVIELIDANPFIMSLAGQLRDNTFTYKEPVARDKYPDRPLSTGDAIHLATAIFLREQLGVTDLTLHTFDEGKSKTEGQKSVPMIGMEKWCKGLERVECVQRALAIPRKKPTHESVPLPTFN